jgi:hypothetical protein
MRRMIRVGPGDEDEDDEPPAEVKKTPELDPAIASFYPKREKQARQ